MSSTQNCTLVGQFDSSDDGSFRTTITRSWISGFSPSLPVPILPVTRTTKRGASSVSVHESRYEYISEDRHTLLSPRVRNAISALVLTTGMRALARASRSVPRG
jgi:hypothetical protein